MQLAGQKVTSARQVTPKPAVPFGLKAPVNNRMAAKARTIAKKAPRKAGVDDLLNNQWMLCSQYYDYNQEAGALVEATPSAGGTVIAFSMIDATTVGIEGFINGASETIQATFTTDVSDELKAAGVIAIASIADGQTLIAESTYGPIVLKNFDSEGSPITAYVFSGGYMLINDMWAAVIGGDGQYAGMRYSYIYSSAVAPVNGTMTWGEGDSAVEIPVVIDQDDEHVKNVTIYNFGGYETAIDVILKEDRTFAIPEQEMFYYSSTYGYVYLDGYDAGYLTTLTGTGTETALTFDMEWLLWLTDGEKIYIYDTAKSPATITMTEGEFVYPGAVPDVAATPADPEIRALSNYEAASGYGYINVTIPTVDVNDNDIREDKLYYQFYSDINGDIQPITFTTDLYTKIAEDMSLIPYTFTDNYDFADNVTYKTVFLNYNFNTMYDRIGVKSIYMGGDETHESNIVWADVEKKEITNEWVAADQGYKNTQDVTDIEIGATVVGKFAAGDNTVNTPKYYTVGGAVRMYVGNTLTITSEEPMLKIEITMTENAADANAMLKADQETYTYSSKDKIGTWTGEATQVVFTVPTKEEVGTSANPQARIAKIAIYFTEEPITLPDGVTPEEWALEGFWGSDLDDGNDVFRTTEVAFDGTDVYVKGLPYWFEDAWLKGKLDTESNIVTFPKGQLVGEDSYGKEYIVGYDEDLCDIQYEYNASAKTLIQLTPYVMESKTKSGLDDEGELAIWGLWQFSYFHVGEATEVTKVEVPEELATETYNFTASEWVEESDGADAARKNALSKKALRKAMVSQPYSYQMEVGFDGQDVYFKGFSENTSDMWAKGTLSADGKTVTIPAGQYLGFLSSWAYVFDYYITALGADGETFEDIVLNYDAANKTFSTEQTIILNGSMFVNYPYQTFTNVGINKMAEFAATPADPSIGSYKFTDVSYPYIDFVVPTQDTEGNEIVGSKLFYTIWIEEDGVEKPFAVLADQYKYVDEDMTEIPYTWDDSWDIYKGGSRFYINPADVVTSWKKFGIQSIYYGGGETHKSNIVWMDNPVYEPTGISGVNINNQDKKDVIYDLQGRRVTAPKKGIYIMNGKKVVVK